MRVKAIGVVQRSGKSKKTGGDYNFSQLLYLAPIEVVAKEGMQVQGYGYEGRALDMEDGAIKKFAGLHFPCDLELETVQEVGYRGIRTLVSGYVPNVAKAAA